MCGGPKVGRSSTLAQLVYQSEVGRKRAPRAPALVLVSLDLATIAAAGRQGLVTRLYEAVCQAMLDPRRFGKSPPVRAPMLELKKNEAPWDKLAAVLAELWRSLEGSPGWSRYAVLLDQGDLLLAPTLEPELVAFAGLLETDAAWAPRAAVIAAGRALREQLLETTAPLAFARPIFLGVLKESEAQALISAPFEAVEEPFVRELLADSGKHPYLLQLLMAEYERRKFETSGEQVAAAIRPATTALFEQVWQELDLGRGVTYRGAYAAPEHALMQYLIEHAEPVELRVAEKELGIKPLKEFAELLEYCGIVERVLVGNASCYRAPGRLWNAWYSARVRE